MQIVPKGLRSFDEHDADFFLALLPGPRDRDGLPDTIRFWKTRIEQTDADATFTVGVLYGPSGCGKSSLVKAGFLPRLASMLCRFTSKPRPPIPRRELDPGPSSTLPADSRGDRARRGDRIAATRHLDWAESEDRDCIGPIRAVVAGKPDGPARRANGRAAAVRWEPCRPSCWSEMISGHR